MTSSPEVVGVAASAWALTNCIPQCIPPGQQERLFPFRVEECSPISRTLTDSAGGNITPTTHRLAPAQGVWENERYSSPRVPFSWDDTSPAAPAAGNK